MKNYQQFISESIKPKLKKFILLVAPPSSGKSTFIKNTYYKNGKLPNDYAIVNNDDVRNEVSAEHGFTYDDSFKLPPEGSKIGDVDSKFGEVVKAPEDITWAELVYDKILTLNEEISKVFTQKFESYVTDNKNIIVDMTNINKHFRISILKFIKGKEDEYEKIAIVFNNGGVDIKDTLVKLSKKRQDEIEKMGGSKTIGVEIFDRIIKSYEEPTLDEGFDRIEYYDNREKLEDIIKESIRIEDIEILPDNKLKINNEYQRGKLLSHDDIPSRMFHVTAYKNKILKDGFLKPHSFGGGFGGGRISGVSVTPSMENATTYYWGLVLAVMLSKASTRDDLVDILDFWIQKQKYRVSGDVNKLKSVFLDEFDMRQKHLTNELFMDAVETARRIMHGVGGRINDKLEDPIIIGGIERLKVIKNDDIVIFEVFSKDINEETPVITGTDTNEIRILGEVKVEKYFKP